MQNMLVKFATSRKDSWSSYLETCVFAYNTSRHDSSKFTPFEVMFGRKATLPVDLELRKKTSEEVLEDCFNHREDDCSDWMRREEENRRQRLELVKANIEAAQRKQKRHYDLKRAVKQQYRVGELVLLKDHTRKKRKGGKLDARWLGPFKICKCLPRGVYLLSSNAGQIRRATGVQLKVYRKPNPQRASNQLQSPNPNMSSYTQSSSSDNINHTLQSISRSISKDGKSPSSDILKPTQSQSTSVSEDSKWPSLNIINPTDTSRRIISEDSNSPSSPDKKSVPYLLPPLHQVVSISCFVVSIFNSVCLFWCREVQVHHGTSPH